MEVIAYEVDYDGFVIEIYTAIIDEEYNILEEGKKHLIVIPPSRRFYKMKWTGSEWIEGATQEEIDEINKVEPQPPTEMELLKEQVQTQNEAIAELTLLLYGGM